MKSGIACILVVFSILSSCQKEPDPKNLAISDYDFLAALIDCRVDLDGNGLISKIEALEVEVLFLDIPFQNSKGIEAFENLER